MTSFSFDAIGFGVRLAYMHLLEMERVISSFVSFGLVSQLIKGTFYIPPDKERFYIFWRDIWLAGLGRCKE
jgi:hypothetical protein